ncbi:class I SAM-dependent methyltransferase [uncultured Tateyamaria sp.]|uniref:class I SAM-dependent methyltransferase n=1 Tax=uncultured Tateyamaria sp. TaxID=455651 RepID=UPI00261E71D3|nr:class I SAM-dependent methyltransferase [uncultured Tateyamaria sp.]
MAATAQGALRITTGAARQRTGSEPVAQDQRFTIATEDGKQAAFLVALGELDPSAPRSEALTAQLIAGLSADTDLSGQVDRFAQNSLRCEFNAQLEAGDDLIEFPPATIALITAYLYHRRIHCLHLEGVLISLRKTLLEDCFANQAQQTVEVALAEAMAQHSFRTEYIWDETQAEADAVEKLITQVTAQIETGADISALALFLIGAYRPLYAVNAIRNWVKALSRRHLDAVDPTLRRLVLNRLIEDDIQIDALTPVTSDSSKNVQSQYEENPYPRWDHLPEATRFDTVSAYVASVVGQHSLASDLSARPAKVLIAGSGTGAHPISVAQTLPNVAVLAIDLSRASLAYASREATARGIGNVAFAQADILKLSDSDVAFDLIESVGVLHHLQEPEAGLQALVKILKPGGYLRLALYSKAARHAVNAARSHLSEATTSPNLTDIRAFRRRLMQSDDDALAPLQSIPDFYAASEFRDLVMHVQEHQFTLKDIDAMLRRNRLRFLGFSSPSAHAVLREMPPRMAQRRMRDLKAWDKHERRHPDTFLRMYDFFCVKR